MGNTILLKGRGTRLEMVSGGTITPGDLVMVNSSNLLVRHSTAKGQAMPAFAVENDLEGKTIDDNYVVNDYVQSEIMRTGDEILARVAASASAIVIGDFLESAGDGTLRKLTPSSQSGTTPFAVTPAGLAVAQAIEAVDNSAGGSAVRIKVRIL